MKKGKDLGIPSKQEALKLLREHQKYEKVIEHSLQVTDVALDCIKALAKRKINVNKELVVAAAILHDICKVQEKNHCLAGKQLLTKLGYPLVAQTMYTHGLHEIEQHPPKTIEQKIIFYADKRVGFNGIMSIEARFEDIKQRYPESEHTREKEYKIVKIIEKELFNDIDPLKK